jgi:pimeloyl-ACP methyl ester carboxylesterase
MSRWIRVIALTVAVAAIAACGFASAPASTSTTARPSAPQAQHDITGAVDVGGGRRMFVECRGTGSQTVVLIAGKGNGAEWQQVLAPADPVHDTPGDDLAVGKGTIERNAKAILPSIARFTRVCAYDRPDIRVTGADLSTPRQQPHTADLGVGDLHALLAALGDPGPYVLVAHSYGGLIAELYARTYPRDVAGLAMVDTVTPRIEDVASLAKLANWDAHNAATSPQVREGVRLIDAFQQVDAAPPMPQVPAVVLYADKPWPQPTC